MQYHKKSQIKPKPSTFEVKCCLTIVRIEYKISKIMKSRPKVKKGTLKSLTETTCGTEDKLSIRNKYEFQ